MKALTLVLGIVAAAILLLVVTAWWNLSFTSFFGIFETNSVAHRSDHFVVESLSIPILFGISEANRIADARVLSYPGSGATTSL